MQILIKNVAVIDPGNMEGKRDILIRKGRFEKIIEPGAAAEVLSQTSAEVKNYIKIFACYFQS